MQIITDSFATTEEIGRRIGSWAPGGTVLRLTGGLGMGKTVLARGIARGMGIQEPITSPTYTLIQEYPGTPALVHMDLYRIQDPDELEELGVLEFIGNPGIILCIEWADRVPADSFGPAYELQLLPGAQPEQRSIQVTPEIPVLKEHRG
ncbi:tRNA (adenosine(37)-N6)-threonylcarbamoyltransferase complex ATPase subunit type 1 TsaE [Spirochaeta africana]|uniref:tRNA threonylcarbamoyladenosine biosynthesis protein TsaE n=1 Tax=Spirochaeta africana (strain ATCC 700263 / DSM 8902 / Z-7692) TaxID=889378 RepID=H9UHA0_SPIAZ|nr:tRNA (adenosine(37)-N6)-threonylcarbamoyltransferase complex ATPase subunit type 1 TsaE [Spirochaeta africana]AFG36893.1 ATPase, YjeE family [Spirochaeta africana DSM 8902]